MPISTTRLIIDKILDGTLEKCSVALHGPTGFMVPECSEIPRDLLVPELSWGKVGDYHKKSSELLELFKNRKKRFTT